MTEEEQEAELISLPYANEFNERQTEKLAEVYEHEKAGGIL